MLEKYSVPFLERTFHGTPFNFAFVHNPDKYVMANLHRLEIAYFLSVFLHFSGAFDLLIQGHSKY
uniref:Uncharacterized protein n=1 Tax=Lepeophtheirus salmonis TaxID=72036 RepID=A0A0K2TTZ7_LEPSM